MKSILHSLSCLLYFVSYSLTQLLVSNDYAPVEVPCPNRNLVRDGSSGINLLESQYIDKHLALHVVPNTNAFLENCNFTDFNLGVYARETKDHPISMGLTLSGGGYRSLLICAGVVQRMDDYGLLSTLNYITGVSGGSWLLMKLLMRDFEDIGLDTWDFNSSLLEGVPNIDLNGNYNDETLDIVQFSTGEYMDTELDFAGNEEDPLMKRAVKDYGNLLRTKLENLLHSPSNKTDRGKPPVAVSASNTLLKLKEFQKTLAFYQNIHQEIKQKKEKGFPLSFTDYWGNVLLKRMSFGLQTQNSSGTLGKFHDLILNRSKKFKTHELPFPIILANCKNERNMSNFVFEFTPYEMGSWHKNVNKFVELQYLGSHIDNSKNIKCFSGLDDIGFIAGTSSSLFNNILAYLWDIIQTVSKKSTRTIVSVLNAFDLIKNSCPIVNQTTIRPDYAVLQPNPFYSSVLDSNDSSIIKNNILYLVDGGEDGENIPVRPLLNSNRAVDLIFAVDASSDKNNWANGRNLHNIFKHFYQEKNTRIILYKNTYKKVLNMPTIPKDISDLSRPTAFGCYIENYMSWNTTTLDTSENHLPPIILYFPNYPHVFESNTSTFKLSYNESEISKMVETGQCMFSNKNDVGFEQCLGCFIMKRNFDKKVTSLAMPLVCDTCFKQYCYS